MFENMRQENSIRIFRLGRHAFRCAVNRPTSMRFAPIQNGNRRTPLPLHPNKVPRRIDGIQPRQYGKNEIVNGFPFRRNAPPQRFQIGRRAYHAFNRPILSQIQNLLGIGLVIGQDENGSHDNKSFGKPIKFSFR